MDNTTTGSKSEIRNSLKQSSPNKLSSKATKLLQKPLSQYFTDKLEKKVEPYEHLFENIAYAPASEFEVLRHQIACLDKELVARRVVWREEQKVLKERWEAAVEKHNSVHEAIPKFNNYYKDLFIKRDRAIEQALKERKQCEEKERDLRRLQKEKKRLDELYEEQEMRLDKFYIFKYYMEQVVESSHGEYADLKSFIDRFGILGEARNNLRSKTDTTYDKIQKNQKALDRDVVSKETEVLALKNYLSELKDYQRDLNDQVIRLEEDLIKIKMTAGERTLIIGQIKMAIRNLYMQVCKHMHRNARLRPEDTLGQLLDIRISVREMYKLAKDIKQMLRQAYLTAEAEAKAREKQMLRDLERQRRIDKLKKKNLTDPRELFGMKRRESVLTFKKSDANVPSIIGGFINPLAQRLIDKTADDLELGLFTFGARATLKLESDKAKEKEVRRRKTLYLK